MKLHNYESMNGILGVHKNTMYSRFFLSVVHCILSSIKMAVPCIFKVSICLKTFIFQFIVKVASVFTLGNKMLVDVLILSRINGKK